MVILSRWAKNSRSEIIIQVLCVYAWAYVYVEQDIKESLPQKTKSSILLRN